MAQRRRGQRKGGPVTEAYLWRPVPALGPPEPIAPSPDPTALIRSLGPLPYGMNDRLMASAVLTFARTALAVAHQAGLTAPDESDE